MGNLPGPDSPGDGEAGLELPAAAVPTRRIPFLLPLCLLVLGLAAASADPRHRVALALAGLTAAAASAVLGRGRHRLSLIVLAFLFAFGALSADRLHAPASPPSNERPPIVGAADDLPWRVSRFLEAAMLGRREVLLPQERDVYRRAGVTHLLAVSGLNVVVLGGVAWLVFSLLLGDGALADYAAATAIAAYVLGIGAPPSALRSGLMAGLLLIARARGHRGGGLNLLFAAAFLTLLFDPAALLDAGCQLSYAATFGLIGWGRRIERLLPRRPRHLFSLLAATIAAQAATLPITTWHFREIAPIAFLSNIAVIPLFTLAQVLTLAALAHVPLASFAADRIIEMMLSVIEGFARLPGSSFIIARPSLVTVAALMALAAVSILAPRRIALAIALGLTAALGTLESPEPYGLYLVRDPRGAIGLVHHQVDETLLLDDGVSARAWRTALSDLGVTAIDTVATGSPAAASSWGVRGLASDWSISEWRAPQTWQRDPGLVLSLDELRRAGIAIRIDSSPATTLESRGRLLALGDHAPETSMIAVSRVGRNAVRIRAAGDLERLVRLEANGGAPVFIDVRSGAP